MYRMFECKFCCYLTERSIDFDRHKKTKKHLSNEQNNGIFNCIYCNKSYVTKNKLTSHQKRYCGHIKNKINNEQEKTSNINSHTKDLTNIIYKELDEKNKELQEMKNQMKQLLDLAMQNSKNVDTSNKNVRSMTRIIKHFNNNPPIKLLESSGAVKLLTYDNKKTENDAINIIITKHKNKILKEYLGDIIIGAYKKEDPQLQSIWGIDTSRFNFALKQTEWTSDKNGINLTKLIITPLLNKVQEMIHEYTKNKIKCNNISEIDDLRTNILSCEEIKSAIGKKKLHKKILQYITPHFEFTSNIINSISKKNINESYSDDMQSESDMSNSPIKKPKKQVIIVNETDSD